MYYFLNSSIADASFRCLSGSVAVSAYELENMPLPDPVLMLPIQQLINAGTYNNKIEEALLSLYR